MIKKIGNLKEFHNRLVALASSIDVPLLIIKKEHLIYLTGLTFIDGCLLVFPKSSRKQPLFFGFGLEDSRGLKSAPFHDLAKHISPSKKLIIEDGASLKEFATYKRMLKGVTCTQISSPIAQLREIKSTYELEHLDKIISLTAAVFDILKRKLKSQQWTEIGLARYIRIWGLELGVDDVSFEPIVAAGANSAVPHHHPTDNIIKPNQPIVIDFGFKLNGYCSDFTRTVFLKKAPQQFKDIYNYVEGAYLKSLQMAQSGMSGQQLDNVARDYLQSVKHEKYFIHSLGHGTGLEVHELPHVGPHAKNILSDGMVFSIEPGIYIPNMGGVRIEDLVYLENGQAHRFVSVPTALNDNIL